MAVDRVSILSLHYPPDATGIAPYAGALAAGLEARHHRVSAYVAHPFYPEWRIRKGYGQWSRTENVDGVAVHRVRHYVPRPPRGIRRLVSELSFGARLLFCRFGSDSVVVAVSPALFATAMVALRIRLMRSRPRLVVWVQDIYTLGLAETKEGGGLTALVTKFVERFALSAADSVVAIHARFAEYLVAALGVDAERISIIQNWTHLAPAPEMSRRDARAALGWPTDVRLIVHTGNMGAKQGLENVVEAARLADRDGAPVKFVLVGDGGERARLEELAAGIERIQFVDPLDEVDYRRALAAADCLLVNELPGVATMAVPSKLTSYFAASRPVLAATDPTGITAGEVERAGAGVAVPAGEPRVLLDTALDLVEDVDAAVVYGSAGRRYCQDALGAEAALDAFDRVIRDVAARRADRFAVQRSIATSNG
ncbi:glycosyltransferase [Mycolicibacterium arabiense]|uniref:glycosyltransferase n=1 Tax=Mycolicibacterium arabiense TaxID=1286181 RepID=UPI0013D46531|nr:glycosyltransferase [Mycolicibacterium arabiense]MCV7374143.1 glycosyltransferase [Mycolicibacterium arabiense]